MFFKLLDNNDSFTISIKNWGRIEKFGKFIKRFFEFLALITIILLPILIENFVTKSLKINYNEYRELLNLVLNSGYIYVVGIVFLIFMFKDEISIKISQIKSWDGSHFKFETQSGKNENNNSLQSKETIMEKSQKDDISNKLQSVFSNSKNIDSNFINSKDANIQENKELNNDKYRLLRFEKANYDMANSAKSILEMAYKHDKDFLTLSEIKRYLMMYYRKLNLPLNTLMDEIKSIITYFVESGILETEDDFIYEFTSFGKEYKKYLFERRKK